METLINIDVPDLEAAIEFYQRATELRLGRRLFEGTVAELTGASVRVLLLQKETGSSPVPGVSLSGDIGRPSIWTSWSPSSRWPPKEPLPPAPDSRGRFSVSCGVAKPV